MTLPDGGPASASSVGEKLPSAASPGAPAAGATAPATRRRRSNAPVGHRVAVAFAVITVVAVAAVAVSAWAFARDVNARHRVLDRIDPAELQTQILLGAYVNQETGVRGYVLTGQDAFLAPYTQGLQEGASARRQLAQLLAHEPASARLLAAAEQRASTWSRRFAIPAVAATQSGSPAYRSRQALTRETALFDQVRSSFAALTAELRDLHATAAQRLQQAQTVLVAIVAAGVVVLFAAEIAAWLAMRAWVTRPLARLAGDVGRVTDGDLQHPIEPTGPPDLQEVGARADAMRRRIVAELDALAEAHQRLVDANDELSRSNVELEQFAYVASHDLQEPLRKITSFCQLLQRRYGGSLDARADEYIAFAVDGATRMQALINDLLAFSRVGRSTEAFVPVDLNAVADRAVRNLSALVDEAGANVEVGPLPTVLGDPSLLGALFQNLIGNAVKFHGDAPPVVQVACDGRDNVWELSVGDNGIGIEPRFAERVFVIFQRLHTKDRYAGTGIGLALCKKIVEFHGGRIWVDTDYHPGTRIAWTLPKTELPMTEPPTTAGPPTTAESPFTGPEGSERP